MAREFRRVIKPRMCGLGPAGELIINPSDSLAGGGRQFFPGGIPFYKTVTSAQLLALFATPISIVAAPGAGLVNILKFAMIYKPAGTAYAGIAAGEDLVFKFTGASGAQVSGAIETTGFLDQTTAQTRYVHPPASTTTTAGDVVATANAAIVLHLLTAEITTGDSPLHIFGYYDQLPTVFTS